MKLLVRAWNAKSGFVLGVREVGAPITACGSAPNPRGGPGSWRIRLRMRLWLGVVPVARCWAWPGAWCSVACLELRGGIPGSGRRLRGPEALPLPDETRVGKEAKGTHAPRGKLLGCSPARGARGITVRPEWQSSSAFGDRAHRGERGTAGRQRPVSRMGKPAGPKTQRLPSALPPDPSSCWRHS